MQANGNYTYLHTPWCRVLIEQLIGLQLVKKFPAFHGTRRFITTLTSVRQLSLSWTSPIQSIYPHPTSWRSILILSTHLRLGLSSGLFPSGFPTKTLYTHNYTLCICGFLSLRFHYISPLFFACFLSLAALLTFYLVLVIHLSPLIYCLLLPPPQML